MVRSGPVVVGKLRPTRHMQDLMNARGEFPAPQAVRLLVDTGAGPSMVSRSLATELGLQVIDWRPVTGIEQRAEMCPVYRATLDLWLVGPRDPSRPKDPPPSVQVPLPLTVLGGRDVHVDAPPDALVDGLLGRDFLSSFVLHYDGPGAWFELRTDLASDED